MEKIIENNAKQLPPETLFELVVQMIAWSDEFPEVKEQITPLLVNVLNPAKEKLDICINNMRGLAHTGELAALDIRRDNAEVSINYISKANALSPILARREAANLILKLLKTFKGINKKEYNKQTGSVRNLVGDFKSDKYKAAVEEIELEPYIDELENANNAFAETMNARTTINAEKLSFEVREVRQEVGNAVNTVCNYLSALALMGANDPLQAGKYDKAFRKLNAIFATFAGLSYKPNTTKPEGDSEPVDYPDAKEWLEDLPFMGVENGDIYYILVDGKKVFYKLIDKQKFFWHPESERAAGGWEKLS